MRCVCVDTVVNIYDERPDAMMPPPPPKIGRPAVDHPLATISRYLCT